MEKEIQKLFNLTKEAFEVSDIKKTANKISEEWNYSLTSTKISKRNNVIVGFNWGAESGAEYKPQVKIPKESFGDMYRNNELGSFQRIYEPLKGFFPNEDIENCVQTNFCMFRSKSDGQISDSDLKLSTPIFNKLIEVLEPIRLISFSSRLRDYCIENNLCSDIKTVNIPSNKRSVNVAKGDLKLGIVEVPIYFLPHPNAKFTSESRRKAWGFCFDDIVKPNNRARESHIKEFYADFKTNKTAQDLTGFKEGYGQVIYAENGNRKELIRVMHSESDNSKHFVFGGFKKQLDAYDEITFDDALNLVTLYPDASWSDYFKEYPFGNPKLFKANLKLDNLLKSTNGLLVYHHQMEQVLMEFLECSSTDAKILRKEFGKKKERVLNKLKQRKFNGVSLFNILTERMICDFTFPANWKGAYLLYKTL
ncbi:MAG: hypothetical protein COB15_12135 [Flavobacteriales bacterium]|nr:MAG: hypothetical protein COB15_12135 [Flavobacteriales bacterium]